MDITLPTEYPAPDPLGSDLDLLSDEERAWAHRDVCHHCNTSGQVYADDPYSVFVDVCPQCDGQGWFEIHVD